MKSRKPPNEMFDFGSQFKQMLIDALTDDELWEQMAPTADGNVKLLDDIAGAREVKFKGETFQSFRDLLVSIETLRTELLAWAQEGK
jgi:hypothetical protein